MNSNNIFYKFIASLLAISLNSAAFAAPLGESVVAGDATFDRTTANQTTINQTTDKAVINWKSFDIGSGEKVIFNQNSNTSIVLNRVVDTNIPTSILGELTANGRVFVVNPSGLVIGAGATLNTAGFLATTSNISNEDFMNKGVYRFYVGDGSATIINDATIGSTNGFFALIAPNVINNGAIAAGDVWLAGAKVINNGGIGTVVAGVTRASLTSGGAFELDTNSGLITIVSDISGAYTSNIGGVYADKIYLTSNTILAGAVNTTGIVKAATEINIDAATGNVVLGGSLNSTDVNIKGSSINSSAAITSTKLNAIGSDVVSMQNLENAGSIVVSGNIINLESNGALTIDKIVTGIQKKDDLGNTVDNDETYVSYVNLSCIGGDISATKINAKNINVASDSNVNISAINSDYLKLNLSLIKDGTKKGTIAGVNAKNVDLNLLTGNQLDYTQVSADPKSNASGTLNILNKSLDVDVTAAGYKDSTLKYEVKKIGQIFADFDFINENTINNVANDADISLNATSTYLTKSTDGVAVVGDTLLDKTHAMDGSNRFLNINAYDGIDLTTSKNNNNLSLGLVSSKGDINVAFNAQTNIKKLYLDTPQNITINANTSGSSLNISGENAFNNLNLSTTDANIISITNKSDINLSANFPNTKVNEFYVDTRGRLTLQNGFANGVQAPKVGITASSVLNQNDINSVKILADKILLNISRGGNFALGSNSASPQEFSADLSTSGSLNVKLLDDINLVDLKQDFGLTKNYLAVSGNDVVLSSDVDRNISISSQINVNNFSILNAASVNFVLDTSKLSSGGIHANDNVFINTKGNIEGAGVIKGDNVYLSFEGLGLASNSVIYVDAAKNAIFKGGGSAIRVAAPSYFAALKKYQFLSDNKVYVNGLEINKNYYSLIKDSEATLFWPIQETNIAKMRNDNVNIRNTLSNQDMISVEYPNQKAKKMELLNKRAEIQ